MSRRYRELPYYEKWAVLGILLGVIAGLSSILVYFLLRLSEYFFIHQMVGSTLPAPLGFGGSLIYSYRALRPYLLPITASLGALASGVLVLLSPDSSGNGTDKVIHSFHFQQGKIDRKGWIIKALSSALTIGSGGSAGREGPTAFVSASMASQIFDYLRLSPEDRRKAVAIAMGSGIGTVFKSPIAGTLLAAELLYRRDFEHEVIYPSLIASAVGYMIFGYFVGYGPVFGIVPYSFSASQIPYLLALGLLSGAFAILYVKSMFFFEGLFQRANLPSFVKPALGGLFVGLLGIFFPEVIAVGYGWMNLIMFERFSSLVYPSMPLIAFMLLLPFLKILATSMTIGSGGSGGEFAPGIMIGGLVGSAFAIGLSLVLRQNLPVAPYAIIGMASLFGAAANAPLAVIVMAVEMGGNLQLFPAAMLSAGLAYIIAHDYSLYHSQVGSRRESPAHALEYSIPVLRQIKVEDVQIRNIYVKDSSTAEEAIRIMKSYGMLSIPVIDESGRFVGAVRLEDLSSAKSVKEKVIKGIPYVRLESTLEEAWEAMATSKSTWVPILKEGKFVGIITMEDMLNAYKAVTKFR